MAGAGPGELALVDGVAAAVPGQLALVDGVAAAVPGELALMPVCSPPRWRASRQNGTASTACWA
ncbi:hypothetical protein AB0J35_09670 [Nonomuraea angiospora]|uniref:hypothetical protein n=1 Tax=Nonomuraea angiospora TaxID=46172 RepID=UPI00343393A0